MNLGRERGRSARDRPPRPDLAAARDGIDAPDADGARAPARRRAASARAPLRRGRPDGAPAPSADELDALRGLEVELLLAAETSARGTVRGNRRRRRARARHAAKAVEHASGEVVRVHGPALRQSAVAEPPVLDVFVTGTDDGVGKTVRVRPLAARARARGLTPAMLTAVQIGEDDDALADRSPCPGPSARRLPRTSAARPGARGARDDEPPVDSEHVREVYLALRGRSDGVLVEGSGGLLEPPSAGLDDRRSRERARPAARDRLPRRDAARSTTPP